ncbi:hypothetical protein D3C81_870920 [compost metagenome]
MLAVGLGDFGQAVLGQNELAGGGVLCIDVEHALFHQSRQIAPAIQGVVVDRGLQAGAEGRMDVGGQGFEQRRHAGEEVVDRGGRNLRALGDAVDRQAGHALGSQQRAGRIEYRIDPGLAACAGFAGGGYACHWSLLRGSGHCTSRVVCCLLGRLREQARSHIGSVLGANSLLTEDPCGSEPARDPPQAAIKKRRRL